jgi:hypothetical protein
MTKMLHVPQLNREKHLITCMKDDCHWTAREDDPEAQKSFEAHLWGE